MHESTLKTPETSQKKPWYAPGLHFSCTQCGNCCTGPTGVVYVSDEEAALIAEYRNMALADFLKEYCEKRYGRWILKEVAHEERGYDCVFLRWHARTGKALCSIYPVRPTQCWTWPFWKDNLRSQKAWDNAAKTCPGMSQGGAFLPVQEIRIRLAKNPKGI